LSQNAGYGGNNQWPLHACIALRSWNPSPSLWPITIIMAERTLKG